MCKVKYFIGALSLSLLILSFTSLAGIAQTEQGNEIKIDMFYLNQVPRGQSREIEVVSKDLQSIRSVEVTPPEGVSVGEMKQVEPSESEQKTGQKHWSIVFLAHKEAQPGERSVVLVTPQGRSQPQTLLNPPHVPELSDIRILSTEMSPVQVKFTVSVFDEAGDLAENPLGVIALKCANEILVSIVKAEKVVKRDSKNSIVYVTVSGESLGRHIKNEGRCEIEVRFKDEKGYESSDLTTLVEFKSEK